MGRAMGWPAESAALRQYPAHDLPLHQLARLVQVVVHDGVRVDADRVIDGRQEVLGVDRVVERGGGGVVRAAVDMAAADAGTCGDGGVAIRPVVAAIGAVTVAGGRDAAKRTAAELTHRYHWRL